MARPTLLLKKATTSGSFGHGSFQWLVYWADWYAAKSATLAGMMTTARSPPTTAANRVRGRAGAAARRAAIGISDLSNRDSGDSQRPNLGFPWRMAAIRARCTIAYAKLRKVQMDCKARVAAAGSPICTARRTAPQ